MSEEQRQHLGFIQTVIGRMSTGSAVAKGWAITIAVATFGYAGTKHSITVALGGIAAVALFAILDTRYLREERRFRMLYDGVRHGAVASYDMNAGAYCKALPPAEAVKCSLRTILLSWSVRDFYGVIEIAGIAILVWAALHQ